VGFHADDDDVWPADLAHAGFDRVDTARKTRLFEDRNVAGEMCCDVRMGRAEHSLDLLGNDDGEVQIDGNLGHERAALDHTIGVYDVGKQVCLHIDDEKDGIIGRHSGDGHGSVLALTNNEMAGREHDIRG